jgi:endonuclease/exonuclease/phosphatase (EEP) superfamily protein YafD
MILYYQNIVPERIKFMEKQQQNWHPISMLPMMSSMISGQLEEANNQYENLLKVQHKPYILNDAVIERVIKVHKEQLDFICLYKNQLSKWKAEETLTAKIEGEINKSQMQLQELSKFLTNILALADDFKKSTIEKVMVKSNLELGLEFFKK